MYIMTRSESTVSRLIDSGSRASTRTFVRQLVAPEGAGAPTLLSTDTWTILIIVPGTSLRTGLGGSTLSLSDSFALRL